METVWRMMSRNKYPRPHADNSAERDYIYNVTIRSHEESQFHIVFSMTR